MVIDIILDLLLTVVWFVRNIYKDINIVTLVVAIDPVAHCSACTYCEQLNVFTLIALSQKALEQRQIISSQQVNRVRTARNDITLSVIPIFHVTHLIQILTRSRSRKNILLILF